jgi:hypothetical protein
MNAWLIFRGDKMREIQAAEPHLKRPQGELSKARFSPWRPPPPPPPPDGDLWTADFFTHFFLVDHCGFVEDRYH